MFYFHAHAMGKDFPEVAEDGRSLNDGIWVLPDDVEILDVTGKSPPKFNLGELKKGQYEHLKNPNYEAEVAQYKEEIRKFMEKYPEFVVASAYETSTVLLLSKHPGDENHNTIAGYHRRFNYGVTSILEIPTPCRILILAEND